MDPKVDEKSSAPAPVGPAATRATTKKGASAQNTKKLIWTLRLEKLLVWWKEKVFVIFLGVFSKDVPTRWMSAFFLLSVFGFFTVAGIGTYRFYEIQEHRKHEMTEAEKTGKHIGEFLQRQSEENKRKAGMLMLGTFTVELKQSPDEPPPSKNRKRPYGVFNLAEIEIVLDCDSKQTRDYIDDHIMEARNQVTGFFVAIDRSDLMTKEGKRKLKRNLLEKLNLWLPQGKIEDLFITRFLMT